MGMDLETLIPMVREKINGLISKPKMSDKLLSKPPFRFLHDTITAVLTTTGFASGLYSEEEMDVATISDKVAKIAYLEKIFGVIGICHGTSLEVKGAKVVAGLEPENTAYFLYLLGDYAASQEIDSSEAVRRLSGGEEPGSAPPPRRGAASDAKGGEDRDFRSARSKGHKGDDDDDDLKMTAVESKQLEAAIAEQQAVAPERGKSRGGTRGGARPQATSSTTLTGVSERPSNMDAEIDKCDGSFELTKIMLGAIISKPKLSDKLLGKPPFRFLHDIVTEVIKVTSFATNLYDPEELDSANVKEKEQKIMFLEKILKVVGVQLNTMVEAKPQKVVAGLESQDTNRFLQLLALAAGQMPDSANAVHVVHEQLGIAPPDRAPGGEVAAKGDDYKHAPPRQAEEPRPRREERHEAPPTAEAKQELFPPTEDNRREMDEKPMEDVFDEKAGDADGDAKRSMRPTTARRRPPKVKDATREVTAKDVAPSAKKAIGIMKDGEEVEEDEDIVEERLADDKGTGDADRNQGQSKLVQDILSRQAEQEAAAKGSSREDDMKAKQDAEDKSGGIRLGRLRKTGAGDKKGGGITTGGGDVERLRKAVQILVQQTGPLGTCMDYIQEDVGIMMMELHRWEEECRKYEMEVEKQKKQTGDMMIPLRCELAGLEEQIREQKMHVSVTKASIAKNESRIQQILRLTATA